MKNFICLLMICAFSSNLDAQPSNPKPYFNAIIVSDIDASIAWYAEKLGFKLVNRVDNEERGFSQVNMVVGSALLELIALKQKVIYPSDILVEEPPKTKLAGLFKFGFAVSDFDEWVVHLVNTKTNIYGGVVQDDTGKKMVIVLDPDGNRIQIFEE